MGKSLWDTIAGCEKEKKGEKIVSGFKRKNHANLSHAVHRLKSFRSVLLVTFLTVNRFRAIWFKWYLTFYPALRTSNGVHLPRWTSKTLSSAVKIP
jgi:hypothetical protein